MPPAVLVQRAPCDECQRVQLRSRSRHGCDPAPHPNHAADDHPDDRSERPL